jgi:serine/threonine protein kinase
MPEIISINPGMYMAATYFSQSASIPLLIDDRFEVMLDDLVGEGGISQVFRGREIPSGRSIAAKRLRPELTSDDEAVRRFEREQRISSVLDHPNIVRYLHAVDGWLFLELVEGETLKRKLADQGPLDLKISARIVRGALQGLEHMHRRGIVHLDLKPQNIMVTRNHNVRLIDLGLAHEFADKQMDRLGTAAYIAPEQIDRGPVDARTDLYALGCVFFEVVTGRPPFSAPGLTGDAEQRYLLDAHRYDEVVSPRQLREDLPPWVEDVIDRALAKDPGSRFASAVAMRHAIDRGLGRSPARPQHVVAAIPRSPMPTTRIDAKPDTGPSKFDRLVAWWSGLMWSTLRWLARLPLRVSRRMSILAFSLLLLMVINVPFVSNVMLEQVIDVVPWSGTTVETDGLNLRASPGTDGAIRSALAFGSEVSVTGLPESRDGITWWPVLVDGERGWVAGSYLEESRLMWSVQFPSDARDAVGSLLGILLP